MIYSDAVMIVKKEIDRHRKIADMYEARNNVVELIKADDERILVDALETVLKRDETERLVYAKWIKNTENGCYWYVCSNCEGDIPHNNYKNWMFSSFCPHCGAKMDVEED